MVLAPELWAFPGLHSLFSSAHIPICTKLRLNSYREGPLPIEVVESWSTGTVVTSRFFRLGSVATALSSHVNGTEACSVQVVCSWSVPACTFTGYTALGSFAPSSRRLEATSRQLQMVSSPTVPTNKHIDITVVWGIRAPKTIPLLGPNAERWSYDPHFQCRDQTRGENWESLGFSMEMYGIGGEHSGEYF
eukprot:s43_g4.t1